MQTLVSNQKVVAALALALCLATMAAASGTPTASQTPENDKLLPRRVLLIGIGNYLYLNPVHEGSPRSQSFPGSSVSALAATFADAPLRIPRTQVFQLADGGAQPHPAELSVLKAAIQDFLDTSRAQDRILIVFAGHATEIAEAAYLVPAAGRRDDPATLLPLAWVYTQMAKCKARQKVLILDAYRFPPALGFVLPGAGASGDGEMGPAFDKALQNPPAGVQVWSSCTKGQRSIEFAQGSVFLQALNHVLQRASPMTGLIEGKAPLPLDEALVKQVNERVKELLGPEKFEQTSRLCGRPPLAGAAYDPSEAPALPLTLKQPVTPGGPWASYAEVDNILSELRLMRPAQPSGAAAQRMLQAVNLPRVPAKALIAYRPDDYNTIDELLKRYREDREAFAKQRPVRAVVLDAMEALRKNDDIDTLAAPSADRRRGPRRVARAAEGSGRDDLRARASAERPAQRGRGGPDEGTVAALAGQLRLRRGPGRGPAGTHLRVQLSFRPGAPRRFAAARARPERLVHRVAADDPGARGQGEDLRADGRRPVAADREGLPRHAVGGAGTSRAPARPRPAMARQRE